MNVFERLSDNPSFQGAMNEAVVSAEFLSSEVETSESKPERVQSPEERTGCESCKWCDEGYCWAGKSRIWYNLEFLKECPLEKTSSRSREVEPTTQVTYLYPPDYSPGPPPREILEKDPDGPAIERAELVSPAQQVDKIPHECGDR